MKCSQTVSLIKGFNKLIWEQRMLCHVDRVEWIVLIVVFAVLAPQHWHLPSTPPADGSVHPNHRQKTTTKTHFTYS